MVKPQSAKERSRRMTGKLRLDSRGYPNDNGLPAFSNPFRAIKVAEALLK